MPGERCSDLSIPVTKLENVINWEDHRFGFQPPREYGWDKGLAELPSLEPGHHRSSEAQHGGDGPKRR
jgi:hypothetical protein